MTGLYSLIRRNSKLFFRDKGVFFTSLITPMILLVLYATFLAKLYRESFVAGIPAEFSVPDKIIDGIVGGQLIS
ncbi:MAG: ABC transporter permease, partial [Oscillospiraceae bacterium]|nr:ABC transporter permease [Oscillospiraceae bacterium]